MYNKVDRLLVSDFLRFKREIYQQERQISYNWYQELLEFGIYIYSVIVETGLDSAGNRLSEADLGKAKEILRRLTLELEISSKDKG